MNEVSSSNFGLLIAYLLPGAVAVWAASTLSESLRAWLSTASGLPTIGGFLYLTLASVGAGLTVSTIRWLLLDPVFHATGIPRPEQDFRKLHHKLDAFELLVESHYRYYQFYANMLLALLLLLVSRRFVAFTNKPDLFDAWLVLAVALFFAGARDTLRKYYARVARLLK